MIKVNNYYGIQPSATDYAVVRFGTNRTTGEPTSQYLTYHATLTGALNRIVSLTVSETVRGCDVTLSEAVDRIQTALDELKKDIEKAVPSVKVVAKDGN